MLLFWERGYEGTSYEALTHTLGISASSFQNAFGSKEALYEEAVTHYLRGLSSEFGQLLEQAIPTRDAFEQLLLASAAACTTGDCPSGCMVSLATIQTSPSLAPLRDFATKIRKGRENALAERIRRGIREGDVPAEVDADALAMYFGTIFRGMAMQARDGCDRETLEGIARQAMRTWPKA